MTNEEKIEKIKALMEEIDELSKELSEEELEAVAGGFTLPCPLVTFASLKWNQTEKYYGLRPF
jgi:hypothetical protein